MLYESIASLIDPDPRCLSIVIIGSRKQIDAFIREQHTQNLSKFYEWTKPQPLPDYPDKQVSALNRILP